MNNNKQLSESPKTQMCMLVHKTGVRFNVNLTAYELEKAQNDGVFATQLIEKYFKMYKNNNIVPAANNSLSTNTICAPSSSNVHSQGESEHLSDYDNEESRDSFEEVRNYFTDEDDELLISLVSARPPLFDMRIPLRERSRDIINSQWEEVIAELNIRVTVKQVSSRWKNIRDSYMRARANVNKKIASGSSAEEKMRAEKIKSKHKHYTLLQFLDATLTPRRTSTNITENKGSLDSPVGSVTPSRSTKRSAENSADESFFRRMDILCANTSNANNISMSATQHFCMRLAQGLEKLPTNIKNKLEIEFLQKISEAEEIYCNQD